MQEAVLRPTMVAWQRQVSFAFTALLLISISGAVVLEQPAVMALPAAFLLVLAAVVDVRLIFLLLLFTTPFSVNLALPGGLTLDTPSEPLMIICTGLFVLSLILGHVQRDAIWGHPIMLLLYIVLLWVAVGIAYSQFWLVSLKYLLAKGWYYGAYVFAAAWIIRRPSDLRRVFWTLFIGYVLIVTVVTIRMALNGFRLDEIFKSMNPFFRNHVAYGCVTAMLVPFAWMAGGWYRKGSWQRNLIRMGMLLFMLACFLSYTRASWLSLPAALVVLAMVHYRLIKGAFLAFLVLIFVVIAFLGYENRYLDYGANFQNALYYAKDLDKHLEATLSFEDLSGMERLYRWAAAKNMFLERPILGFGPNTFNETYRAYVVTGFETLVSDNPERSTVHNNFILVLIEMGLVGLMLFFALVLGTLLTLESLYHRSVGNKTYHHLVIGVLLCFSVLLVHMVFNDLTETDKMGTFFLLLMVLTARLEVWLNEEKRKTAT
jgi:O-antigen ligase